MSKNMSKTEGVGSSKNRSFSVSTSNNDSESDSINTLSSQHADSTCETSSLSNSVSSALFEKSSLESSQYTSGYSSSASSVKSEMKEISDERNDSYISIRTSSLSSVEDKFVYPNYLYHFYKDENNNDRPDRIFQIYSYEPKTKILEVLVITDATKEFCSIANIHKDKLNDFYIRVLLSYEKKFMIEKQVR